jgi:hypothetical protein
MNIRLGKFNITSDEQNFILQQSRIVKESKDKSIIGSERLIDIGYYTTLDGLLMGVMKHELRRSEAKTIQELLDAITSVKASIDEIRDSLQKITKA